METFSKAPIVVVYVKEHRAYIWRVAYLNSVVGNELKINGHCIDQRNQNFPLVA